jgi:DNA topoisomerase-6 subunit B
VPLLFQQGACAITNAVSVMDWRRYGLDQKGGSGLPIGPVLLLVHIASTKIPFTSEAKEAVAEDPEIDKEITLAVQAAARHLKTHLSRRNRQDQAAEKFLVIQRILPRLAEKTSKLVGKPVPDLTPVITKIMDIVYVESAEPETDKVERRTTVHVTVTNYTPRPRVLELFVEMPKELFGPPKTDPAPDGTDAELGRAWWTLPKLLPNTRTTVHLTFPGISIDADDLDWYVAGVDEAHLIGAEALPGDWDVRLPRAVIEAATAEGAPLPLGEDGEVDLDGAEAQAGLDDE